MRDHYSSRRAKPNPKIYICWEETGTGKSKWAFDAFGGNSDTCYWVAPGFGRIWWGGYEGQHTVIFDDFTPDSMPVQHFKLMTDRYAYRVEGKGTQMAFTSKTIVFTTNANPKSWYRDAFLSEGDDSHWKAVQRRLRGAAVEFQGQEVPLPQNEDVDEVMVQSEPETEEEEPTPARRHLLFVPVLSETEEAQVYPPPIPGNTGITI